MTADDEILRLRREVAEARVQALDARLAEAERRGPDAPRPLDGRLAAAPRHVPLTYWTMLLPWSWKIAFALLIVTTAPIIVWIGIPEVGIAMVVIVVVAILGIRIRTHLRQISLLRWGEVVTVTDAEVLDQGTYFSGMTYHNMRVPVAHGWDVDRGFYNGPGTKTRVRYALNGSEGALTLRGRGYTDGVILAHQRRPDNAACVSAFPYDLDRTPDGNWTGDVRTRLFVGSVVMLVVLLGWAAGMLVALGALVEASPQFIG